jgi:hypothetical protein
VRRRFGQRQCRLDTLERLARMAPDPEDTQCARYPQRERRLAAVQRPIEGRAHIVQLGLEPAEPARIIRPVEVGVELVGEPDDECQVPVARRFAVAGFEQFVGHVLAERFQHAVAGLAVPFLFHDQ